MPTRPPKDYWDIDNTTDPANIEAVLSHFQNYPDVPIDAVNVLRRALAELQQRAEHAERSQARSSNRQHADQPVQPVTMPANDTYTRAVPHKTDSFVCVECGEQIELLHYPGAFLPSVCDKPTCQANAEQRRKQANTARQKAFRARHATNGSVITNANQVSVTPLPVDVQAEPDAVKVPKQPAQDAIASNRTKRPRKETKPAKQPVAPLPEPPTPTPEVHFTPEQKRVLFMLAEQGECRLARFTGSRSTRFRTGEIFCVHGVTTRRLADMGLCSLREAYFIRWSGSLAQLTNAGRQAVETLQAIKQPAQDV